MFPLLSEHTIFFHFLSDITAYISSGVGRIESDDYSLPADRVTVKTLVSLECKGALGHQLCVYVIVSAHSSSLCHLLATFKHFKPLFNNTF